MTTSEFQAIFTGAHDAVAQIIRDTVPAGTRIFAREAFDEDEGTWVGRLKNTSGKIHCWTVAYTGTDSEEDEGSIATDVFVLNFMIVGYLGLDFGTDAANSAKTLANEIAALRFEFMNNRSLGEEYVSEHLGFSDKVGLVRLHNSDIHVARINLKVKLTPLAYEFN